MLTTSTLIVIASIGVPLIQCQTTDTASNPAFNNIAPCACDLTENQFDNNCCCDGDYSGSAEYDPVLVSSCIQGPFGGNFTTVDDRVCSASQTLTPDWFPLLCIQFLNSPSLGLYYYPSTEPSQDLLANPNSYDISDTTLATTTCGSVQSYDYGEALVASFANSSGTGCTSGNLPLPQQSLSGVCVRQSPVQYLVDTESSCDVTVTRELCGSDTILDAASYSSAQVQSLSAMTGSVSYLCAQTMDDSLYVKTNIGSVAVTGENLFTAGTATDPVSCRYAAPTIAANVCLNSVASVEYTFTWNGSSIANFDIVITLVNVSLTTSDSIVNRGPNNLLTQTFSALFTPLGSAPVAISGNPGYEFGLPVLSASDTGVSNVNRAVQLTTWKQGTSDLCVDATREAPRFGFDSTSGCSITFGFLNCTFLRSLVEAQQMQLLEANVVSRFGNPSNASSSSDWIPVLSNITQFIDGNETAGVCDGIPSRAVLEFLWARSGEQSGQAIREIVGARVSLIRESWSILCTETQSQTTCSVSNYPIYSTVTFTEVPPRAPTPQTLYELRRNDTCERDATCWPELLLPIQPEFFYLFDSATADTLRSYNYGWALVVTFFSIAAVLVPAHWNSVGRYLKQALPI